MYIQRTDNKNLYLTYTMFYSAFIACFLIYHARGDSWYAVILNPVVAVFPPLKFDCKAITIWVLNHLKHKNLF